MKRPAVLGIDAAWTVTAPSGVALVEKGSKGWRCVAVAASYAEFIGRAARKDQPRGPWPGAATILEAARRLLDGSDVVLVAADIPLALSPITARREADQAVSHKPSAQGTAVIASAAGPQMIPTGCVPCASGDLTGAGGLDG